MRKVAEAGRTHLAVEPPTVPRPTAARDMKPQKARRLYKVVAVLGQNGRNAIVTDAGGTGSEARRGCWARGCAACCCTMRHGAGRAA